MSTDAPLQRLSENVNASKTSPRDWSPPFCGDIDMHIRRDGQWFYAGTAINRPALVKLFARVLRKEGDEYFLVTPVEKVRIRVDDAPFLIIDADVIQVEGIPQRVELHTSVGDRVVLDESHPLRMKGQDEAAKPYVHIRDDLWALVSRPVYYRLVEHVETLPGQSEQYGIHSQGLWFRLV